MNIFASQNSELEGIYQVHKTAFGDEEASSITSLVSDFLEIQTSTNIISLVYKIKEEIVGHIIFSEVKMEHPETKAFILAPLGVSPNYQKQGIGTALIKEGLRQLESLGINLVFVYGDPNYYSRFSFSAELAKPFIPPYPLQFPHGWQVINLMNSPLPTSQKLTCLKPLMEPSLW